MLIKKSFGLLKYLNPKFPIIQAPMAGGIATPKLVAAVNESGGLGSLPLGYLTVDQARTSIRETKLLTKKPFIVNIFVNEFSIKDKDKIEKMNQYLSRYRELLGIPLIEEISNKAETPAEDLITVALEEGIQLISFTFGIPSQDAIQKMLSRNVFTIGTATTVKEGIAIQEAGLLAVVGQGYEAGGHRGSFFNPESSYQVGTLALIPQLVDALKIPVIAAGGIMDGRGLIAALSLGASAAQLGTAFIFCPESGASSIYRKMLTETTDESTVITTAFTGKHARGIKNQFIEDINTDFKVSSIPDYPSQHYLSQKIRSEANKVGKPNLASFWAGQGSRLGKNLTVPKLMQKLQEESEQTIELLRYNI